MPLVLPGSSPFAGVHRGAEAVGRFLLGLRRFVIADEEALSYSHEGDELIASNDFLVHGPRHAVEMTMRVRVAFDEEGKIGEVFAEPDDVRPPSGIDSGRRGIRSFDNDRSPSAPPKAWAVGRSSFPG